MTKHGKPIARLQGIRGQDLSKIAGREALWDMLADRLTGPSTPIDEVWDEMGVPRKRVSRRRR